MNVAERATVIATEYRSQSVREMAHASLDRILACEAHGSVPGEDVARLLASLALSGRANGSAPRVVARLLDDGVAATDGIG